jgi:hypothetical protein
VRVSVAPVIQLMTGYDLLDRVGRKRILDGFVKRVYASNIDHSMS